jgi:hypothetical protein
MRRLILISVPDGFAEKFINFIHNVNLVNNGNDPPIVIERVYDKEEGYVAIPEEEVGNESVAGG